MGKRMKAKKTVNLLKIVFLILIIAFFATIGKIVYAINRVPDLDTAKFAQSLKGNSKIVDKDGNIIGEVAGSEFRSYISINDLPKHVVDSFVAIEDKRFYSHKGVDIVGLGGAMLDNIRHMSLVRGGSTITQQLIKNTHLSNAKTLDRKIQEAYLAYKLEKELSKDEILEAYLNSIFFGQNAYGIESAANIYFSKSASNLTIDEGAILAAIVQNPNKYAPYIKLYQEDIKPKEHTVLGEIVVGGARYSCIYNNDFEERRDLIIKELYKQKKITDNEFSEAIQIDPVSRIKPSSGLMSDNMIHLIDIIKEESVEILMNNLGISKEKAEDKIVNDGYTIYTSIDKKLQNKVDELYNREDLTQVLLESLDIKIDPNSKNLIDKDGNILYYAKDNLLDKNSIYFTKDEYKVEKGNITIKSDKIEYSKNIIFYKDYYNINKDNELYIYNLEHTKFEDGEMIINEDKSVTITKEYLEDKPDFFTNDGKRLVINTKYYEHDMVGKKQPDSSMVLVNPIENGLAAIYGSRNAYNGQLSNKAKSITLPPYELLKPFSLYYPYVESKGEGISLKGEYIFPSKFRSADKVELPNAIYRELTLENKDNQDILDALKGFELINSDRPDKDNFILPDENSKHDVDRESLAYGRLKKGLSIYDLAKATSQLNNENNLKMTAVQKIIAPDGKVIYDKNKEMELSGLNKDTKFIIKNGMSYNNLYYIDKNYIYNGRHSVNVFGSDNLVITTLLANDNSKLKFSSASQVNRFTKIVEDEFIKLLSASEYKAPSSIKASDICNVSGLLATDKCRESYNSEVSKEYLLPKDGEIQLGTCNINHKTKSQVEAEERAKEEERKALEEELKRKAEEEERKKIEEETKNSDNNNDSNKNDINNNDNKNENNSEEDKNNKEDSKDDQEKDLENNEDSENNEDTNTSQENSN